MVTNHTKLVLKRPSLAVTVIRVRRFVGVCQRPVGPTSAKNDVVRGHDRPADEMAATTTFPAACRIIHLEINRAGCLPASFDSECPEDRLILVRDDLKSLKAEMMHRPPSLAVESNRHRRHAVGVPHGV